VRSASSADEPARKARGRRLRKFGVGLVIGGFLFFNAANSFKDTLSLFDLSTMLLALACMTVGAVTSYYGRQLAARTAKDALAEDSRPPIVYLRSFKDDNNKTIFLGILEVIQFFNQGYDWSETHEESLANVFSKYGPFVAIGKPGEALPTLGAARIYAGAAEWKKLALEWIGSAMLVIVRLGRTEGVWWEATTVLAGVGTKRLLFELPWFSRKAAYARLQKAFAETHQDSFPEFKRKFRFVYFDASGACHVLARRFAAQPATALEKMLVRVREDLRPMLPPVTPEPAARPSRGRKRAKTVLVLLAFLGGFAVLQAAAYGTYAVARRHFGAQPGQPPSTAQDPGAATHP
jgi:hypothetical protein